MAGDSHVPRIFTIPPGASFLDTLADALAGGTLAPQGQADDSPFALADALILLPTRRACRAFAGTLAARSPDAPLLLPKIRALGDVDVADLALDADEDVDFRDMDRAVAGLKPAISQLERQLLLTRLVETWGRTAVAGLPLEEGEAPLIPGSPAMAAHLAAELARMMDAIETEGVDFARAGEIVPDGFARFWQIALDFLDILASQWPAILDARSLTNPAARRNALIAMEAERLMRNRPSAPVIAAGSTGSIPATAELLRVIAGLPSGAVVLPGLDLDADDADWTQVLFSPSHPQHGMARLLSRMKAERADVAALGEAASASGAARARIAATALRPAETTDRWHGEEGTRNAAAAACEGMTYVAARTVEEEALAIALILRETAEDAARTAALVTPDRTLARRVQAALARWNIAIDDFRGTPLATSAPGAFARLAAGLLADGLEPVPLLALLKHPLCRLGMAPQEVRRAARALEIAVLRGPRPQGDIAGLRRALDLARAAVETGQERARARKRLGKADWRMAGDLLDRLEPVFALAHAPLEAGDLGELIDRHHALCTALAADEEGGPGDLFSGEAGLTLNRLFDELKTSCPDNWRVELDAYPALFTALLSGRPVRAPRPAHPRLHILGLLEARLLHFDLVILGGLNEGAWPAETRTDPWLSRPMRAELGLPPPERRIGLSAHDFAQGFTAARVVLTRAERVDGDPSVESRWLKRLDAVLQPSGGLEALKRTGEPWLDIARQLDGSRDWRPQPAPRPCPPVELRPRKLSVTEIETWIRDPYSIYARHVLRLEPLDAIDQPLDAAARGTVIHGALHRLFADGVPEGEAALYDRLAAIGDDLFAALPDAPEVKAFWRRRFLRAARWFAHAHAAYAERVAASVSELRGELKLDGCDFTLTARADRIDRLAGGGLAVIDYKTGLIPTGPQVASGLSPQLSLEAAMAQAGGFAEAGIPASPAERLIYIGLGGGTPPGKWSEITGKPAAELAAEALSGLKRKAAAFADAATPYLPRPHPMFRLRFDVYDHLARVKEWSRQGAGDGE